MALIDKPKPQDPEAAPAEGISLTALADHLGPRAAEALFSRIDGSSRQGEVIIGTNVRDARIGFSKAQTSGRAQFVVPGRSNLRQQTQTQLSDGIVIISLDDLEAVVRAGQEQFDWAAAFAPRGGLTAATMSPQLKPGSRGRRPLRV